MRGSYENDSLAEVHSRIQEKETTVEYGLT